MITIKTDTPQFYNDICEEIRLFISADKIDIVDDKSCLSNGLYFLHTLTSKKGKHVSTVQINHNGIKKAAHTHAFVYTGYTPLIKKRDLKAAVKLSFYWALSAYTGKKMPWGALTGVRPTKLVRDMETRTNETITKTFFLKNIGVSKQKFALAKSIVARQKPVLDSMTDKALAIYIGIPFCPTVCAYCSFSSKRIKKGDDIQNKYMAALLKEIKAMTTTIDTHKVRSVYIGGGTPTSLDLPVLAQLLTQVSPLAKGIEFTVEAGRPDTIDDKTLKLLKKHGVNRISINPQTFKQQTLIKIGRKHTLEEFYTAYKLARQYGFTNINIDLIFGLPDESMADMRHSLMCALRVKPQSITIHTLSIKNAADFTREIKYTANEKLMRRAVNRGLIQCEKNGLLPYYMYKQKYMKGNLENVGYAKKGYECKYNIEMMEEVCSVLAFGAGAISKKVYTDQNRHTRIANVKDIDTYIARIDDMIDKKKKHF